MKYLILTALLNACLIAANPLASPLEAHGPPSKTKPGPTVTEAQLCGGLSPIINPCPTTETCYSPITTPILYDAPGRCIGQTCGGFMQNPRACPSGQLCTTPNPLIADIPGKCVPANQKCGGIAGIRCPTNWRCVRSPAEDCRYGRDPDCFGICYPSDWR